LWYLDWRRDMFWKVRNLAQLYCAGLPDARDENKLI
jgi:hypothetical protein